MTSLSVLVLLLYYVQDVVSVFSPTFKSELQTAVAVWTAGDRITYGSDINAWDVSGIQDMSELFRDQTTFNDDISGWDVSGVIDMGYMFYGSVFNQDIGSWDVSSATDMAGMFAATQSFNQDISSWDVSGVSDMYAMFFDAAVFNQDIGAWDVSKASDMTGLFNFASSLDQVMCWDLHSSASGIGYEGVHAGPRMSEYNEGSALCECRDGEHTVAGPGPRGSCSSSSGNSEPEDSKDTSLFADNVLVIAGIGSLVAVVVIVIAIRAYVNKGNGSADDEEESAAAVIAVAVVPGVMLVSPKMNVDQVDANFSHI